MEKTGRNIRLIWDFRGEYGHQTAIHHEIHLKEFVAKEQIPLIESGVEELGSLHSIAFVTVPESHMRIVRDALIPHRGEIAE